jgi:hypothetical protein
VISLGILYSAYRKRLRTAEKKQVQEVMIKELLKSSSDLEKRICMKSWRSDLMIRNLIQMQPAKLF